MLNPRIADRYAKTLFELALEKKELKKVYEDVLFLSACIKSNKELKNLLANPIWKKDKKIAILTLVLKKYEYPKSTVFLPTFSFIIRKGREMVIAEICKMFFDYYFQHENIVNAKLITASPPTNKVLEEVKKFIHHITQSKEEIIENIIDSKILGGLVIEFNHLVLDASLRTRMNTLKQNILEKQ